MQKSESTKRVTNPPESWMKEAGEFRRFGRSYEYRNNPSSATIIFDKDYCVFTLLDKYENKTEYSFFRNGHMSLHMRNASSNGILNNIL